jgi:transcriptional antiterminator NusG
VKANLEKRVESMGMEDKIFRVLVPMEEEIVNKDGKKKSVMRKVYPGYVLVEMIQTDDSWYVVRNTPGVTGFVGSTGSGSKPTALLPEEVEQILRHMGIQEPKPKLDFELKESVRVKVGPFANFVGTIEEIMPEKGKLKVHVNMFGRETPVELEFTQVEKV